jgi:hypothetical protein
MSRKASQRLLMQSSVGAYIASEAPTHTTTSTPNSRAISADFSCAISGSFSKVNGLTINGGKHFTLTLRLHQRHLTSPDRN